jgi:rhamnulokinase
MADTAQPFLAILNPDDPSFLAPKDMPGAIAAYCRDTGQRVPETKGEIVRVVLESLALRYRWTMEKIARLQRCTFDVLHVVGGGSQNSLLCQFTADATGVPVMAGPVEATAMGNAALQAVAMGELASLDEARQLIRRFCDVVVYEPGQRSQWDDAYQFFEGLVA